MISSLKNKKFHSVLLNILFAALAIVSLYYAFRNKDLHQLGNQLKSANYWYILPILASALMGSIARALRWRLLLKASGYKVSLAQTFFPLMYGYFVNIGTPRLGEITRCASLNTTSSIPFSTSFGTVFTERCIDLLCLILVVVLAFTLQVDFLSSFFYDNIFNPINDKTNGNAITLFAALIIIGVIGLGVIFILLKALNKRKQENKVITFVKNILLGITSIFKLKKRAAFLFYTLVIWFSYFLTSYLWFFAFEATENLTVAVAFTVMAVGAIAKSLPIQGGGVGAYHFLVGELMVLYQLSGINALAYATVNHATQLVYHTMLGIVAVTWLFLFKRNAKTQSSQYTG